MILPCALDRAVCYKYPPLNEVSCVYWYLVGVYSPETPHIAQTLKNGPRPIHVYLLRYTDKVKILKAAAKALKDKVFLESQIHVYISDDVSKLLRC